MLYEVAGIRTQPLYNPVGYYLDFPFLKLTTEKDPAGLLAFWTHSLHCFGPMQDVLDKIKEDAKTRLIVPEGRLPNQELTRYKAFLKVESHRLLMHHRGGAGGLEVCHARALVIDLMLQHMWETVKASLSPQSQKEFPKMALVALGGYGRAELNPFSDIDFMFLHELQVVNNKPLPHLARMMDGILYSLWDLGLKIGHSVRTVDEAVKAARDDMQSKTGLIEARLVVGSQGLLEKLQKAVIAKCVKGLEDDYILMRIADQAVRHGKYGNSPYMQEPNIKNGCGGLRDYQNLLWMTFFKYGTRSLAELEKRELISPAERKHLENAYDYLLRVRNELHYLSNRAIDVLGKNVQPKVAHNLGFTDRSPSLRLEKFMSEIYLHSRNIYLINRTLELRLSLRPEPSKMKLLRAGFKFIQGRRKVELPQLVDGFKCHHGFIEALTPRVFKDQPRRLMRVFLHAQQRGLRLHPDLSQLVQANLALANREFLNDPHVTQTFLEILNQRGSVAPILRAMHEVGLLGKYLPEFGKVTCLVQHEFYHLYTTDEHTLVCLEQLDKIWEAKVEPHSRYTQLFQSMEHPYLLYLAMLLHDTGKKDGHGHHETVSSDLAARVARRLKLDGAETHNLRLVIENHLLMAIISQRRDLEDPAVTRSLAKQLQNLQVLNMLTVHTFADSLGTSDKLWNEFKDSLLRTLYQKTSPLMTGGGEFLAAEERTRELLSEEIKRLRPVDPVELEAHFSYLPPRYFQIHSATEILRDMTIIHQFRKAHQGSDSGKLNPIVNWHNEPDRGYTMAKICTWDRKGLFSQMAGSFSAAGLSILTAQIFTRSDGIALDTFYVVDARSGVLVNREERERFEATLLKSLTGDQVDFKALITRQKVARPPYQSYEGDTIPTEIRFDNNASETRTVMEVETEDRLGLLFVISQSLAEINLDISAAKIVTERGAAIDTFYLAENGKRVDDKGRQSFIERKVRDAIEKF